MQETLFILVETDIVIRALLLGFLGFLLSMLITPLYTTIAYARGWWKPSARTLPPGKDDMTALAELHGEKAARRVPTMAGMVFVTAVALVTAGFNLTRAETWLPLAAFVGAAGVGLLDDIIHIRGHGAYTAMRRRKIKLLLLTLMALVGGWYFYDKLDVTSIHIPGLIDSLYIGWLIVPLFVAVVVITATAVNVTDGLDGLAGGLTSTAFGAYAVIAAMQGRFGVAAFCLTVVGALLSYTWFNIAPARFYMGDVGSFALGTALGAVAMITDTVLILPVIGLVFLAEAGSSVVQAAAMKLRGGRGLFKITPLHLHFAAMGWPEAKVTMRFWILGQVCAVLGLVLFLFGGYV